MEPCLLPSVVAILGPMLDNQVFREPAHAMCRMTGFSESRHFQFLPEWQKRPNRGHQQPVPSPLMPAIAIC